jgi:hypothetical protein
MFKTPTRFIVIFRVNGSGREANDPKKPSPSERGEADALVTDVVINEIIETVVRYLWRCSFS